MQGKSRGTCPWHGRFQHCRQIGQSWHTFVPQSGAQEVQITGLADEPGEKAHTKSKRASASDEKKQSLA